MRQALVTHGGVQACWEREARGTTSGRRASSVHGGYATAWRATSWGDRGIDFKRTASFDCLSAFRSTLLHELMLLIYCVTRLASCVLRQPTSGGALHSRLSRTPLAAPLHHHCEWTRRRPLGYAASSEGAPSSLTRASSVHGGCPTAWRATLRGDRGKLQANSVFRPRVSFSFWFTL